MRTESYSEEFDRLRKNRCTVSEHKYGSARKNFGSGYVDALATAELCIEAFKKDHNAEHLVDAANYLMFRWMYPMSERTKSEAVLRSAILGLQKRVKQLEEVNKEDY